VSNSRLPTKDLSWHPHDRAINLHNTRCAYCGTGLDESNRTRDHVIAQRLVPKGKLHQQWNLIVKACRECNNRKSDLEDDISAITMQPDGYGRFAVDDQALRDEAGRKATAGSRRTRKPVGQSRESISIETPFMGGATMKASFTSAAQIDQDRAYELAVMQVAAVFHYVTFNPETRTGGYMLGEYRPIMVSPGQTGATRCIAHS